MEVPELEGTTVDSAAAASGSKFTYSIVHNVPNHAEAEAIYVGERKSATCLLT